MVVFIVTSCGSSFSWIESLPTNENLRYKSFPVSTCRILPGVKCTPVKTNRTAK